MSQISYVPTKKKGIGRTMGLGILVGGLLWFFSLIIASLSFPDVPVDKIASIASVALLVFLVIGSCFGLLIGYVSNQNRMLYAAHEILVDNFNVSYVFGEGTRPVEAGAANYLYRFLAKMYQDKPPLSVAECRQERSDDFA